MNAWERQITDGWVLMLDVDLDLAQRMLRLPADRRPVPPIAVPAVLTVGAVNGSPVELLPAIDPPAPDEPPPAPRPTAAPRGAYARRARQETP